MAYDMRKGAKKHVYHVEHYYVSIVKGIRFIADGHENEDGDRIIYHGAKGLNDEKLYNILLICEKNNSSTMWHMPGCISKTRSNRPANC